MSPLSEVPCRQRVNVKPALGVAKWPESDAVRHAGAIHAIRLRYEIVSIAATPTVLRDEPICQDAPNLRKLPSETLNGWQQIAVFLGEPVSVIKRWAAEGMPVRQSIVRADSSPLHPMN